MIDKEIITIFREGSVEEITDFLRDVEEQPSGTTTKAEIEELFSFFNYDKISQESYKKIEDLLFSLMCLELRYSEMYKLIVEKVLKIVDHHRYLVGYLIEDNTLGILSKEQLESLEIRELTLENMNLGDLPEKIGYISSLEEIYLNSRFSTLPVSLNRLKNLKKLAILFTSNDFDYLELPNVIESLTSLEALDVSFFNTHKTSLYHVKFPISFDKFSSLKSLRLIGNYLWHVPKEVTNLTTLENLDLSENKIKELPITFNNLINLKSLNLESNSFEVFPEVITSLTSLKELYIGENSFPEIPNSIGNLKSLEVLKFATDWFKFGRLKQLPASIGNLDALRELDLSLNRLESLPESIGKLKTLEILNLTRNPIHHLPDNLGNLSALKMLDISHTQIDHFPLKVSGLVSLETVCVSSDYKNDFDGLRDLFTPFKSVKNNVIIDFDFDLEVQLSKLF